MVGVNKLPVSIRHTLLSKITNIFAQPDHKRVPLYLIFTETTGMHVFSWLPQVQRNPQEINALPRNAITPRLKIAQAQVIQGPFGSGKSYSIRSKLTSLVEAKKLPITGRINVSINEDWRVSSFIEQFHDGIKNLRKEEIKALGVHFNVSAYANYSLVNTFFYNFIYFGLIWDEYTGEVEYVPRDVEWYFFVELSSAPESDEDFQHVSDPEAVFNCLPALRFAPPIQSSNIFQLLTRVLQIYF